MCFASTYDVIKGMDGEHLISCQFHFSVFHNIWSMDIPTCQTSGPLFWSPRVDLVLKVKWHIRLYSCTFRQTCISLPSLLKKTCSCSYMRHIYIIIHTYDVSLHKSLRDLQSLLTSPVWFQLRPSQMPQYAAMIRHVYAAVQPSWEHVWAAAANSAPKLIAMHSFNRVSVHHAAPGPRHKMI